MNTEIFRMCYDFLKKAGNKITYILFTYAFEVVKIVLYGSTIMCV